jgi:hypothetical protein
MSVKRPNFFIVGAPKSGTTAMYEYLRVHPEIFMPDFKEPYFFGNDLTYLMPRLTLAEYMSLFAPATDEQRIGEASVTYLYSRSAAKEIHEFDSHAKIIIMLRDPVEMIYSLHSQLLYTEVEDTSDFEQALAAESDRKQGLRIPPKCTIVDFLLYREFGRYFAQVERYLDRFAQNVHIILYDDFRRDVPVVYEHLLRFLEVDSAFRPNSFRVVNQNKIRRNEWLKQLFRQPEIVRATRVLLPSRSLRQSVAKHLQQLTIKKTKRPPMPYTLKQQLRQEYLPEVERLSDLVGRDLSAWTKEG